MAGSETATTGTGLEPLPEGERKRLLERDPQKRVLSPREYLRLLQSRRQRPDETLT